MLHFKSQIEILKTLIYILTLIPFLTFAQTPHKKPFGTYTYSDGRFYYRLKIKRDSSFTYEFAFKLGSTKSSGSWKLNKDTLYLFEKEPPWKIINVDERKVDSLIDKSRVEIIYLSDPSKQRPGALYIDGVLTIIAPDSLPKKYIIAGFKIWVNDSCQDKQETDSLGIASFSINKINTISIDYDSYNVKDKKSNYFILTLSTFPIYFAPPSLTWSKWVLKNNTIIPIDCNILLDYITLKK